MTYVALHSLICVYVYICIMSGMLMSAYLSLSLSGGYAFANATWQPETEYHSVNTVIAVSFVTLWCHLAAPNCLIFLTVFIIIF